jgi:hypothetical protein
VTIVTCSYFRFTALASSYSLAASVKLLLGLSPISPVLLLSLWLPSYKQNSLLLTSLCGLNITPNSETDKHETYIDMVLLDDRCK